MGHYVFIPAIEVSSISKKYRKSNTLTLERFNQGMGAPILLGIIFFFIVCLGCADAIKSAVMVIAALTLFVIAVRFNVLRERIHWPFIALTLYVIMNGISTFYAVSGKFALREFLKVFLAYLLAVILLATSPKKEETSGKRISTILAVCTAFGSLVSIDLISTRWISGAVLWVLGHFTRTFEGIGGFAAENYTRISSVFSNSNVFSGFSGLGTLLSLVLSTSFDAKGNRYCSLVCLYINLLAFILSFSIGASAFLVLAFLVLILLKKGEKRIALTVQILEALFLAIASAALIYATSFKEWTGIQPIPLLCTVCGAAVLQLLDLCWRKRTDQIQISQKRTGIIIGIVVILAIGFVLAAWNITGDIVLMKGESLRRAVYPKPGEYSLELQTDGNPLNVTVTSQSKQQAMMRESTVLYSGDAYHAEFTVPKDSIVVYCTLRAPDTVHINDALCGEYRIPLRYKLLPEFVAYRLQGAFSSQSMIQRTVFFKDGIKLFRRRPIIGLGMGAFENGIKSVQTFYYETKYAHNHYFQTLLEIGIIGLLLFVGLLVSSAAAVWKCRKTHPYASILGACLVFMAGQAVHDVVFSSYAYLPIAFGAFAVINLCCGEAIQKPELKKACKVITIGIIAACTVVYCVFLACNMLARQQADKNPTLQTLVQSERLDKFEWADYALPYVVNATGENINPYVLQQAEIFAERLEKVDSNTIPIYLAEYYFSTDRMEQGISMVEKYVDYVSSDEKAWERAFDLLRAYADDSEAFRDGVILISEKLEKWNGENLGNIQISDETKAFIAEYR